MTKIFRFAEGVFTCEIQYNTSHGYIEFNFNDGTMQSNRPAKMANCDWLMCIRKFVAIAMKMNAPFLES